MSTGDKPATPADDRTPSKATDAEATAASTSASEASEPSPASAPSPAAEPPTAETTPPTAETTPVSDQPSAVPAPSEQPGAEPSTSEAPPASQAASGQAGAGPLAKRIRASGPLAARGLGVAKPASPSVDPRQIEAAAGPGESRPKPKKKKKAPRPRLPGEGDQGEEGSSAGQRSAPSADRSQPRRSKIEIPNIRQSLPDDVQAEFEAMLGGSDLEEMMSGSAGATVRKEPLSEGARVHGQVLKIHEDNVFVALGGPDEGVVPFEQFKQEPAVGESLEVIVRGVNREDGLFILSLPGGTVEVSDWDDLEEGSVVEATVTGSNSGGLECKVGGVKGFIPISQISEYRVEDTSDYVNQKLLCVVTESNARRGNLVLSHRAILEREREEKRQEQLAKLEVGDEVEGTVRSIKDFGAFVDMGGLDGLIHISKLSWERIKHPSEVLEEGQKVKVRIDKIDKDTGKISLSYRDLLENPWDAAEQEFSVGSVHRGVVTRVANFGCFVKLAPGVEGLVHVSELAHHRVSKVDAFVQEGNEVEVKVLGFDREAQKISLSIKAAQQATSEAAAKPTEEETLEPPREVAVKATHGGPLRGGNDRETGGERFGLRW